MHNYIYPEKTRQFDIKALIIIESHYRFITMNFCYLKEFSLLQSKIFDENFQLNFYSSFQLHKNS